MGLFTYPGRNYDREWKKALIILFQLDPAMLESNSIFGLPKNTCLYILMSHDLKLIWTSVTEMEKVLNLCFISKEFIQKIYLPNIYWYLYCVRLCSWCWLWLYITRWLYINTQELWLHRGHFSECPFPRTYKQIANKFQG